MKVEKPSQIKQTKVQVWQKVHKMGKPLREQINHPINNKAKLKKLTNLQKLNKTKMKGKIKILILMKMIKRKNQELTEEIHCRHNLKRKVLL